MSLIKQKIEAIIKSREKSGFPSFAAFLFLLSRIYGGAVRLRGFLYRNGFLKSKKLPCKTISVGNITVGGTGKTPMVIYLTALIKELGYAPAILSRGYKGRAEKSGGIVSNGRTVLMSQEMAGDEPFMLAQTAKVPVLVGQNRFKSGMLAVKAFQPDVIVLDDAFQHLKLFRDIDLVLLDYRHPFGNGYLLPRGPLREPLSSLVRGHGFIFTRSDDSASPDSMLSVFTSRSFKAVHLPYISRVVKAEEKGNRTFSKSPVSDQYDTEILKGCRSFAFSGIANNQDFRNTAESMGFKIEGFSEFPDHYPYSAEDFSQILHSAASVSADILLTTEKDYARIGHRMKCPFDLVVIGIKISFGEDENAFRNFIQKRLAD
jgi:tetraacyldisaccharide 4'-kinase